MIKGAVGLILAPLLSYPVLFGCLALADSAGGERLVLFHARYEQRRLWDTFWVDYASATPVMYVAAAVVLVAFMVVRRLRAGRLSPAALVPLSAIAWWSAAAYLSGSWIGASQAAMVVGGAVAGLPLFGSVRSIDAKPSRAELP